MKILSIDTSSNICGVAILEDENLIKEISLDNGLTHSESLMPTVNQIFKETNLSLNDIDLLVCDKGPGSFTGIRIGTATVMAFADSLEKDACGITSLEALAYNVQIEGIICSLIDAKHSNCYCGVFELKDGNYKLLQPLFTENIETILDVLKNYNSPITFVGSGAVVNKDKLENICINCSFSMQNDLSAYNLGLAGLKSYSSGNYDDVMPLYLRKSQAERLSKKD